MGNGVATHHKDFDRYAPKWKRCRDVSDGQDAMHRAGEAYLRKLTDEDDKAYSARLSRSNFFNGSWRTIAVLQAMLFRKPPAKELPNGIEPYLADINMGGMSLDTFARTVALETLEVGRVGIMVDHPAAEVDQSGNVVPITQAAAVAQGMRPMLQFYRAECIINWRYRRVRNRNQLCLVVLHEKVEEPDGEFEVKEVDQYRVLDLDERDLYRVRLFQRENEKDVQIGGDLYPLMNGKPMGAIPFGIVGIDGLDSAPDEPPLIDLIDANIAHYQVNSDHRHGLHFTALPTPYVCGYSPAGTGADGAGPPEKLYIGSTSAWVFTDPQTSVGFLEFQGQGLDAVAKELASMKQDMAMLGARAIADESKHVETLGATIIKRGGEQSILSSAAMAISEAMEWALAIFAEWAGQKGEVKYQLNRDFMPAMIDAQMLTALVSAVQAGKISDREFFELLQRGDVIDSEISFDEHQAEVEVSGGPVSPSVPASPSSSNGEAVTQLDAAIARHERHMNGTEPTSDASQMKMMDEMKAARAALVGGKSKPRKSGMAM